MESGQTRSPVSQRRRDILDASLRCFMKHGIDAATIEQIREASGASSGSIYHHFGSKLAIAIALYVEGMEFLAESFQEAMAAHQTFPEGIRALLCRYFDWVEANRDWALYLLRVATADLTPEGACAIDEINRRTRDDLALWLKPYVDRGEVVSLPADLYSSLVFGASTHYVRHWLVGRLKLDLTSAAEHLAEATCRALLTSSIERVPRSLAPTGSKSESGRRRVGKGARK